MKEYHYRKHTGSQERRSAETHRYWALVPGDAEAEKVSVNPDSRNAVELLCGHVWSGRKGRARHAKLAAT